MTKHNNKEQGVKPTLDLGLGLSKSNQTYVFTGPAHCQPNVNIRCENLLNFIIFN